MKKFWADFKKFISRGNIVDMAVGVIIGGAFSAIVTALTNKIIRPLINWVLSLGGSNGLENAYTFLRKVETAGVVDLEKSIYIDWGSFITAIIDFLLIALVLFIILRAIMNANSAFRKSSEIASNKELRAKRKELRKSAKEQGRPFKEVWAEHVAEQERIAKEKADAEAKLNHKPSQEELLTQIRDLLADSKVEEQPQKTTKKKK